jgi:hypothetical protein
VHAPLGADEPSGNNIRPGAMKQSYDDAISILTKRGTGTYGCANSVIVSVWINNVAGGKIEASRIIQERSANATNTGRLIKAPNLKHVDNRA